MFKTGDIIINNSGTWGHVLMCMGEEDDDGIGEVTFIHGTNAADFKIGERTLVNEQKGNYWHFHPKGISDFQKGSLEAIATKISQRAKYGAYRAVRLAIGNSDFGKGAQERLAKYEERLLGGNTKIVTKITCVEAVVLCHQLTYSMTSPQFIRKDAAHTLPRTLAKYLKESPGGWEAINVPK